MRVNQQRILYLCAALTLLALLCCALPLHHDCDEPACALCSMVRMQRAALGLAFALFTLWFSVKSRCVGHIWTLLPASVHPTLFDLRVLLSI